RVNTFLAPLLERFNASPLTLCHLFPIVTNGNNHLPLYKDNALVPVTFPHHESPYQKSSATVAVLSLIVKVI
ncbi:hypothetical protein L195_g000597, partial [Trifolium pratense]